MNKYERRVNPEVDTVRVVAGVLSGITTLVFHERPGLLQKGNRVGNTLDLAQAIEATNSGRPNEMTAIQMETAQVLAAFFAEKVGLQVVQPQEMQKQGNIFNKV